MGRGRLCAADGQAVAPGRGETVGRGETAETEGRALAEEMARQEAELEQAPPEASERFLSWHEAGQSLPLDRTVRDFARSKAHAVAVSTATR